MQSEKKEKKTKKKASSKDETPADTPAAETPAAPTPSDSGSQRGSTRGSSSRKAKKAPSSVFVLFSQKQIAEFKEVSSYDVNLSRPRSSESNTGFFAFFLLLNNRPSS